MGLGFVVIARQGDPAKLLDADLKSTLAVLSTHYVTLNDPTSVHFLEDLDGRLDTFLMAHGWNVMIVRPDFYVYGGATDESSLVGLVRDMIRDLKHAGFTASAAVNLKQYVKVNHEARTI